MKKASVFVMLFVALALSVATSGDSEKKKEEKVKSGTIQVSVTAAQLYKEYEANEVAADGKYKGKIIAVSGVVSTIGKDLLDKMYVSLKTSHIIGSVQCFFAKSHQSELANLKKNTEVTLKCLGGGKMGNVILRGCIVK